MERSISNETRLAKMEQKIDDIKEDLKEISSDIKALDGKYSGKWVETLTLTIAGGMVIAILVFLLK